MPLCTPRLQLMRCIHITLLYQIYDKPLYLYLRDRMGVTPRVNGLNRELGITKELRRRGGGRQ